MSTRIHDPFLQVRDDQAQTCASQLDSLLATSISLCESYLTLSNAVTSLTLPFGDIQDELRRLEPCRHRSQRRPRAMAVTLGEQLQQAASGSLDNAMIRNLSALVSQPSQSTATASLVSVKTVPEDDLYNPSTHHASIHLPSQHFRTCSSLQQASAAAAAYAGIGGEELSRARLPGDDIGQTLA